MTNFKNAIMLAATVCSLGSTLGCTAEMGEDTEFAEPTEEAMELLDLGAWAGPYSNGAAGPNPVNSPEGSKFCQAYDSRDNKWHPGKLWTTSCRYEWGGGVVKRKTGYYTLQLPANYSFVTAATPPAKAVVGFLPGQLYLCVTNATQSPGKVWGGKCLYEFSDDPHWTTLFRWVVKNP